MISGGAAAKGAILAPAAASDVDSDESLDALRARVAGAVRRVCPAWLATSAEDIVQNVLVQLSRTFLAGEGRPRPASMYFRKAAYGATVDEIRRRCRRREVQLPDGDGLAELAPAAGPDPERSAASAEIGRGVQECLLALARARRLAVTLYLQGCTVPETARRLGWKVKQAENLVYRGLADLRACLSRKGLAP